MSIVGGYPMTQNYGGTMASTPENFYSQYYTQSPSQQIYPSWGYSPGYTTGFSSEMGSTEYPGFVMGPGSPNDFGGEYTIEMIDGCGRVVKRRTSANKKERRRTQSINNAFSELRDCIPNVPADTKLSKIKTLRLATSYIAYLMQVLSADPESTPVCPEFKAELPPKQKISLSDIEKSDLEAEKYKKGRTGWPQAVWAQELKK